MEVTAIDVGQGDSLLVVSPQGQTMLVDAGGPVGAVAETADATSLFDVGEEVVSPYLWSRQIRRLDVIVLSHAHSDHMGGMAAVMRSFRPRELWVGIDPDSTAYRALLAEAHELGITVRHLHAGDALPWSGTQVNVLAPDPGYVNGGAPVNNDSLVMRVEYGKSSVLLEGDAEAPSETGNGRQRTPHTSNAAKGRSPRKQNFDDTRVLRRRSAQGCSRLRRTRQYLRPSAVRSDPANRR